MALRDRIVVTGLVNGKFYLEEAVGAVYGNGMKEQIDEAMAFLRPLLQSNLPDFRNQSVLVGVLREEEKRQQAADIFGFGLVNEWPGEPEVRTWTACGHSFVYQNPDAFPEESRALFEIERRLLMSSLSLAEYLDFKPAVNEGGKTYYMRI